MAENCDFCKLVKEKDKYKIYFESEEILVIERNDNLAIGMMKNHVCEIPESKISGIIKIMLRTLGKFKPNHRYSIKYADDCKAHYGIYATIKIK